MKVAVTNRLRELRARYRMSQEELARRVGVTRQTIIAIENGKYLPSLKLAFKIARVFGVKIEDIFIFNEEGGDSNCSSTSKT
ncbi:MAG: helix-turn-helix transcriptional regulator [Candidatus Nezhaarchaeales archaeon]